jgi:hypothetical protein
MINAITATQADINAGLAGPFEVDTDSFKVESSFSDPPMQNDRFAAVPWSVTATHVGPFVGLEPTNRVVVIEGVTIVTLRADDDQTPPEFQRYVDWSAVFGQLGVVMTGRPILATPPA